MKKGINIFFVVTVILLKGCGGTSEPDYGDMRSFKVPPKSHREKLLDYAKGIALNKTVDDDGVGIDARETDQYRRFKWLCDSATNDELIELIRYPSVNVKIYAYGALCGRNHAGCRSILEQHLSDRTPYTSYSGCE